jgi:hypothetical protein
VGGCGDPEREHRLEVRLVEAGVGGTGIGLSELGVDVDAAVAGVRAVHARTGRRVGAVGYDAKLVAAGQARERDPAVAPGGLRVKRHAVQRDLADAGRDQVSVGGRAWLTAVEADQGDRAEGLRALSEIQVDVVRPDPQQPRPLSRLRAGDFSIWHSSGR